MLTEEQRVRAREADKRYRENHPEKVKQKDHDRYLKNRDAELARNAKYHRDNREHVARRNRNRRHRLTQEQYDAKVAEQNNSCAICHKIFEQTPHVDHNHQCCSPLRSCSKCRRGLLCEDCNLGLGRFKDSIEVLSNAIEYLKGYQQ